MAHRRLASPSALAVLMSQLVFSYLSGRAASLASSPSPAAALASLPPPPPLHNGLTSEEQAAILETHNIEREKHGVASLYWDYSASDFAGGHLSSCPGMVEDASHQYGENLFGICCLPPEYSSFFNVSDAVTSWYDEISDYNFNNPGYSLGTGHFTQVVWKSTKGVGCAKKTCSDDWTYLDCNYVPPGNVIGQFAQNVFSIKS